MKKTLLLLMIPLLLIISACGGNQLDDSVVEIEENEKVEEMRPLQALVYMEAITGKYAQSDMYQDGSDRWNETLKEALLDIENAVLDMREEPDTPMKQKLLEMSDVARENTLQLLEGNTTYERTRENSTELGKLIGTFSRAYLDGKLPPSVKAMTGMEDAN